MANKKPKRFRLNKGDIVQFDSPNHNYFGHTGRVVGYLEKDIVLVEVLGNSDYASLPYLPVDVRHFNSGVLTGKAKKRYKTDDVDHVISMRRVLFRKRPKPKKRKKPPRRVHLIDSHEALQAALSGALDVHRDDAVVVQLPEHDEGGHA